MFARTSGRPDGICLDAEMGVWYGGVDSGRFERVTSGGEVTATIATDGKWAVDCTLGGHDGRRLFMATAKTTVDDLLNRTPPKSEGFIEFEDVDIAGAGWQSP
jgi:sugar lactone lactonase YvrE